MIVTGLNTIMDFKIFEASPGIQVLLLPDAPVFTHVAVSNDFVKTSGMKREKVIGTGHFSVFPKSPDDPNFTGEENLKASFAFILEHKQPHEIPVQRYDIPNGDGSFSQRYWWIRNAPVLNDLGEVVYIIHTAQDITEKVLAEQKLESSKGIEKAYSFFMSAPVIIGYVKGDDYIIELANEDLLEVWGKTSEVIGKPLMQALPELEEQGFRKLLDQVRSSGQPFYANEYPIKLVRNGKEEVLYFDFVYKPYYESETDKVANGVISVGYDVTEQVNTRQKFKNVIAQAPDPILILKGEQMVLEVANQALFNLWRVDESAIGKTFLEILPEMKGQGFLELLQQVYHTGQPVQGFETPAFFEEKDGTTRAVYFNFTYQPYREADGSVSGVLVLATDVTTQVLSKQEVAASQVALKLNQERLELVSKATQDAVWDWNILTNELVWNEAVYTLFGYNAGEVENVDRWWIEHVHPDDREEVSQSVYATIKSGENFWMREYRFKCGNGEYRVVLDRGFIQYDAEGTALRMIGSMQDITERKRNELALKESQQKWQQLANSMPVIVWTTDAEGQVDFMNRQWVHFTGQSETDALGTGWVEVVHFDDVERCLSVWKEARVNEILYEMELRYRTKEGEYRWVLSRGIPIKADDGAVRAWFGTSTDIHEQRTLAQTLEQKVSERTSELSRSNANLEEFAYAASHDMKEPIRKIHFFSDRLRNRLSDKMEAEDFRLFERMQHASKRMATLIDDLLDYSQATKGVAKLEQIDLNAKVQLVLEDLELEIQEKGAMIHVAPLPVVAGNHRQLQQLFQNLISNALKYSQPGIPPEINISATMVQGSAYRQQVPEHEADRQFHKIEVKDNGIGFDQADADRIFNVFTRLHSNTEYRGTGVGLSIVRKVVENHQGYIWAESNLAKGSSFIFLLPVVV